MNRRDRRCRTARRGFTLIELMIVVAVIGLLASIAVPSYLDSVARARRVDGRAALLLAAQAMERYRAENSGSYLNAALSPPMDRSPATGTQMYRIELSPAPTPIAFTLRAVPTGPMTNDDCGILTLSQDGLRTAAGQSSGAGFERCWGR